MNPQTKPAKQNPKLQFKDVRLSFPRLWTPKPFEEGGTPTFGFAIILDKKRDALQIAAAKKLINAMCMQNFGKLLPTEKLCLRDGADKPDTDGYGPGVMYLSCSGRRPMWVGAKIDGQLVPLPESGGKPYPGCYVNANVSLWVQKNKFGMRINAQPVAVAFVRDGEAFGQGPVDPEAEFADMEDSDLEGGGEYTGAGHELL